MSSTLVKSHLLILEELIAFLLLLKQGQSISLSSAHSLPSTLRLSHTHADLIQPNFLNSSVLQWLCYLSLDLQPDFTQSRLHEGRSSV